MLDITSFSVSWVHCYIYRQVTVTNFTLHITLSITDRIKNGFPYGDQTRTLRNDHPRNLQNAQMHTTVIFSVVDT